MCASIARRFALPLLALLLLAGCAATVAAAEVEVQAFAGRPFGVGKMTVHFDRAPGLPADAPLWLSEKGGRALYPAIERTGMRVPTATSASGPTSLTAYFLFRGDEPLDLTLKTDQSHRASDVRPGKDEAAHERLLDAWWDRYVASVRNVASSGAYQPLMENYLMNMLGRRLGREVPKLPLAFSRFNAVNQAIAVMTGAESVRIAAQTDTLLQKADSAQPADQDLPTPVRAVPVRFPEEKGPIEIEPIAHHVPVECFYIRCGSFSNFSWLRQTIDQWGGKIRHIASVRGIEYGVSRRIERQLALRETALAKLLGDTVISDVAIVGTDTFLREGASIGVVFEARSDAALRLQIMQQRQEALAAEKDATEKTIQIADQKVSLLSTPGNQVRSFWAVDGKYHLITTSRTIVRRFFEAGQGRDNLGDAKEYRWARSTMPLSDNHTVFAYLSDPFFRQLVSPHYRIEMTRRTRAAAEGDLVRLAQLAAAAEGVSAKTVGELMHLGLLPAGFEFRPDGSRVVVNGERMFDSLRGAYGSFLPVPDVEISKVTQAESQAYRDFARMYERQWRRMDPTIIGLKRRVLDGGAKERLIFDVHITPYAQEHYGFLATVLGAAEKKHWALVPGDIAAVEVKLWGHNYTLGLRDFAPLYAILDGRIYYSGPRDEQIPLYLGALKSEKSGLSGMYLLDESQVKRGEVDESGDVRVKNFLFGEGWLRKREDVSVVAMKKALLDQVTPYLERVPAEREAKARLRVGDLSDTDAANGINAEGYIRARKVSAGNVYFLHALMQQLHVPADDVRAVAEQLLHGQLVCPLGGEYKLESGFTAVERWQSTGWARASLYQETHVPQGFRTPLLNWLAGLSLDFNIDATTLSTHIELDVRPTAE